MKRVICTIPNCPDSIMGINYTKVPEGMLSDPMPNEEADRLCTINGYQPYVNADDAKALADEAAQKAADANREAEEAAKLAEDLKKKEEDEKAKQKQADESKSQESKKGKGTK